MSFVTYFNHSKADRLVVNLSTENGNYPKKIPFYFLTYYLNLWEGRWLLYAHCNTTTRDIDFLIVHMNHCLKLIQWNWMDVTARFLHVKRKSKMSFIRQLVSAGYFKIKWSVQPFMLSALLSVLVSDYTYQADKVVW